jgi:hypothetical protein
MAPGNAEGGRMGKSGPVPQPVDCKAEQGVHKPANREAVPMVVASPSRAAIEKALVRIKEILGSWFYGEVKGSNLIQKAEEIVQFAELTDTQMREIGSLLKRGWAFGAAFQEIIERLTPDDQIRALHTRSVANGVNWYISSVGGFGHIVAWGPQKDRILVSLRETLERLSIPQRS